MATFLQKVRLVTLGSVHDLLDKAIDANSPSALRQYVRDLEDALDRMKTEAAVQAGQVRTLFREQADLESRIETTKATAKKLVDSGHPDLARPKATDILRMQEELKCTSANLVTQQETSKKIDIAVGQLESKHEQIVFRVRELERLDRDSKAKEAAATSLAAAGRLIGGGTDISIDDIQSKMLSRNDAASEKFDRAVGDVKQPIDPEQEAKVDDLLASLK